MPFGGLVAAASALVLSPAPAALAQTQTYSFSVSPNTCRPEPLVCLNRRPPTPRVASRTSGECSASLKNWMASEGTGIGLALVRRLVQAHGGQIPIESQGRGRGTVFHVSFAPAEA